MGGLPKLEVSIKSFLVQLAKKVAKSYTIDYREGWSLLPTLCGHCSDQMEFQGWCG
jgi:hypothetical protein